MGGGQRMMEVGTRERRGGVEVFYLYKRRTGREGIARRREQKKTMFNIILVVGRGEYASLYEGGSSLNGSLGPTYLSRERESLIAHRGRRSRVR